MVFSINSLKKTLINLSYSKPVLYILVVITVIFCVGYFLYENVTAIILFGCFAVIAKSLTRNMSIILASSLILTVLTIKIFRIKEGFTAGDASGNKAAATAAIDASLNAMDASLNAVDASYNALQTQISSTVASGGTVPSNTTTDESFISHNGKHKIDYASTVEEAYDNLNKVLGGEGMKRLTSDTQTLMKQQQQLAESMKNMTPLIQGMAPMMKQAQDMLSGISANSGGLGDLMKLAGPMGK